MPLFSETYTFCTRTDDGVRLYVNGERIIDHWTGNVNEHCATITLNKGEFYDIQMDYFEGGNGARAALYWESLSQIREIIPASQLYSGKDTAMFTIEASAGPNGTIDPSGAFKIQSGFSKTFVITPDIGYKVAEVIIDGQSIGGGMQSYTFNNVFENHTIAVAFDTALQTPYHGAPFLIEDVTYIQTEDYDNGGNYVSYYDSDPENQGGEYREDYVDIGTVSDVGGGYKVGWSSQGEWLEYTVDVTPGTYNLSIRYASDGANVADFKLTLDGTQIGYFTTKNTGGWETYETLTVDSITLAGGTNQILRLELVNGYSVNYNWIRFSPVGTDMFKTITATADSTGSISPSGSVEVDLGFNQTFSILPNEDYTVADVVVDGQSVGAVFEYEFVNVTEDHSISASFVAAQQSTYGNSGQPWEISGVTRIEAENHDQGGLNVAYFDQSAGNEGGSYRNEDVDIDTMAMLTEGFYVGYTADGEWLEYTIDVMADTYNIKVSVASDGGTIGDLRLLLDGQVIADYSVNNTGGWLTFETLTVSDVPLTAGSNQVLRVEFYNGGSINFDYIEFVPSSLSEYTITASAGANGSISPSGSVLVAQGDDQTFSITPDSGYEVADVFVSGNSVGAVSTYTFANVTATDSISANFKPVSTSYPVIHSVSEESDDAPAEGLIDGDFHAANADARWSAYGMPQSVIIDYGENKSIIGTKVYTYKNRAYQYKVELSEDLDFSGDLVVDRLSNTSGGQPITDNFGAVTARYAKITVTGAAAYTGSWVSLIEFEIVEGTSNEIPEGYPVINSFSKEAGDGPATNLIDDNTDGCIALGGQWLPTMDHC